MKTYEVEVNGQVYIVKLREISEEQAATTQPQPAKEPTQTVVKAQPETVKPVVNATDGEIVAAPMAGVILSVAKKPGDMIKKGDVLFILEAMKMENEILSPADGVVKSILVSANQAVESNQPLMTM